LAVNIYTGLMGLLLMSYFYVMATYSHALVSGRVYFFPTLLHGVRIITAIMAIRLGKLWRNKGFLILLTYYAMISLRILIFKPDSLFTEEVSDSLLTGIWVFCGCYGLAFVLNREQLKKYLFVLAILWTVGMTVNSCIGVYTAWSGRWIYTIGKGSYWGVSSEGRLWLTYYMTTSGSVLSISVLIALAGAYIAKRPEAKAAFIAASIPMIIALSLTDSRSAQVTMAVGVAVLIGIALIQRLQIKGGKGDRKTWLKWAAVIIVMAVVFATMIFISMKTIAVFNRLKADGIISRAIAETGEQISQTISNRGYTGNNILTDRPAIWKAALQVIKRSPKTLLFGVSIADPMAAINQIDPIGTHVSHCHNMPIMILLENGAVGFLLIGVFMFLLCRGMFRTMKNNHKERWRIAVIAPVISILVGELVECFVWLRAGEAPTLPFFFILAGVIIAGGLEKPERNAQHVLTLSTHKG